MLQKTPKSLLKNSPRTRSEAKAKNRAVADAMASSAASLATEGAQTIVIAPPNFQSAIVEIVGTSPYVMNKMSSANRLAMMAKQESGERSKKGQKRKPKDFNAVYRGAMHISKQGWHGIPASSIRAAMISACKLVGFHMTRAKLCLFVVADGIDADDGQGLVKIIGRPIRKDMAVKLADGSTDIIARPFFEKWSAKLKLEWDADQFSAEDVLNLLNRVGRQVGIGAGRNDSKNSTGMGWGCFTVRA